MRLLTTVIVGRLLDWNEHAYGVIFALAGVAGFAGMILMARMEAGLDRTAGRVRGDGFYRPLEEPGLAAGIRSMRESAGRVVRILRDDHRFRRFEVYFFIYGIAFLAMLPIVPLFLVHDLGLDYTRIGLARGLMGQSSLILLAPFMGRWMRRVGPVRFCGWVFSTLALYPLCLLLSGILPPIFAVPFVYAAFVSFGTAMAGVTVAWNLSSIHFAGDEDPSSYQAVHSTLVGLRAVTAPLLGFAIIRISSSLHGFVLCAGLFATAGFLMTRMARRDRDRH